MFEIKFEPDHSLLTVIRSGTWSLETVKVYEAEIRKSLAVLQQCVRPTAFVIDIRSKGAQPLEIADALRAMVARLGTLRPDRTAVVTSSGIAKLQARRVSNENAQVFTSMVLARDWLLGKTALGRTARSVYDDASQVEAEGHIVHVYGPADVDFALTPSAAIETAKRIGDAAAEVLLAEGATSPEVAKLNGRSR